MDKATPNGIGTDAKKEDQHRLNLLDDMKKDIGGEGKPVKDIPHEAPPPTDATNFMKGPLMTFTQMLESLDEVQAGLEANDNNIMNTDIDENDSPIAPAEPMVGINTTNDDELLETLNELFTPILIMQGIEGDISEQVQEACSESNLLTERNIIQFDDSARMAQLRKVCALLIARQKDTQDYQMYKKAADIQRSMSIKIQKDEFAAANALAQKYLVKVSTTNNSSVARKAANELLPETQH